MTTQHGIVCAMIRFLALSVCLYIYTGIWQELKAQTNKTDESLMQLRAEVQNLAAGQKDLQAELSEIKSLLKDLNQPRASTVRTTSVSDTNVQLETKNDPTMGSTSAPVTLIEYTDFQCPFCERHHNTVMNRIIENFVDTGKVRYVSRDYPLSFHPQSAKAHEATHCASDQGRYWEMRSILFSNRKELFVDKLAVYASTAGVADLVAFQDCLNSGIHEKRVKNSISEGFRLGVRGTPAFIVGLTQADGTRVKGLKFIYGAQAYAVFENIINVILKKASVKEGG